MSLKKSPWGRMIVLVDMNAFFASVEQADNPKWQKKPVAITNGMLGSTIITCSYEARAKGVKTGMHLKQAKLLCPRLIRLPSRPERYAEVSTNIMHSLTALSPDVEVFSVDEAFIDMTGCQHFWESPQAIAMKIKRCVWETAGIYCSVGISGDKTTAKYAAKLQKPNGMTVILPWEAEAELANVPVTELCGINRGIGGFLAARGVYLCGDMKKIPVSVLGQRFGNPGRRIWLMAQGKDPEPLTMNVPEPQSIGHGKMIPPNTKDRAVLELFFLHMSEKVAARLRRYSLSSQQFYIGLNTEYGWMKDILKTPIVSNDGQEIYVLCKKFLDRHWHKGLGCFQVQVTALSPCPELGQIDFMQAPDPKKAAVNKAMDQVNERYGEFCIAPAPLLNRSTMPNVIAPAWKPTGHRQTIEKTKPS